MRRTEAVGLAGLALSVYGFSGYHVPGVLTVPLLVVGSLLFVSAALVLLLRGPADNEGDYRAAISADEASSGGAFIGVENCVDVTIDNNTVYGPGQLLDAKRVTGLRARGNRRRP